MIDLLNDDTDAQEENSDKRKLATCAHFSMDASVLSSSGCGSDDESHDEIFLCKNIVDNTLIKHKNRWFDQARADGDETTYENIINKMKKHRRKDLENFKFKHVHNTVEPTMKQYIESNTSKKLASVHSYLLLVVLPSIRWLSCSSTVQVYG